MQYVYQRYNCLSKTYYPPFVADGDPKCYGKQVNDFIILHLDQAKSENLDECQLYYLGTFDQENGTILFSNPDQSGDLVLDCIQVIKQLEALKNAAAAN